MSTSKTIVNETINENEVTKEIPQKKKSSGRKKSGHGSQRNLQKYNIKLKSVVMQEALAKKETQTEDKFDHKDKKRISFAKDSKSVFGGQEKHGGGGSKVEEPPPSRGTRRRQSTLADLGNLRMPQAPRQSNTGGDADDGKPARSNWCEELSPSEIAMFRQVFEFVDRDGGGSLDANELFSVMKELEMDVSLTEIKVILKDLDKDGNGEIDFDEFMYAMFETDRYLDQLYADPKEVAEARSRGSYGKRQTLFFTAITRFAIKNSLGDIDRFYAAKIRHAPHVISYYTAGARLIGLNDRQLEQQMRQMQKAAKNTSSPYAQPQPFYFFSKAYRKQKMKERAKQRETLTATPGESQPRSIVSIHKATAQKSTAPSLAGAAAEKDRRTGIVGNPKQMDLLKTLQAMAEKGGNVVANIPDIQKLSKLESAAAAQLERTRLSTKGNKTVTTKVHGWKTVRTVPGVKPLPVIKVKPSEKPFTIDDVTVIRKRVSQAMNKYYRDLKKAIVKSSAEHWDDLYSEEISSDKLRDLFRDVYRTYAPQKVDDVFVRCPWLPGPRYGSHQAGKRITYLPSARCIQTATPGISPSPTQRPQLPLRPVTAGDGYSPHDLGLSRDRETPSPLFRPSSCHPYSQ